MTNKSIAFEMSCKGNLTDDANIICIPFCKKRRNEYRKLYNECFDEMRKALEIEPVDFYSDYAQMKDKTADTFLYLENGTIIGAVSCYGNEVDDLIVKGLGRSCCYRECAI